MAKPKKLTLDDLRSIKAGENAEAGKKKDFWKHEGRGKSSCIEGRSIVGPGGGGGGSGSADSKEKCKDDGSGGDGKN